MKRLSPHKERVLTMELNFYCLKK